MAVRSLGRVVDRGALPQRTGVTDDAQLVVTRSFQGAQFNNAAVRAAVIDDDDFEMLADQRTANFFKQRG